MPTLPFKLEPGPPPPHPRTEAQGREWAGVRREPAPAGELDGVVLGRSDRGVEGVAAHGPGRAARVFRPGDPDGADAQGRVPAGAPPDRGADRLRHRLARARPRRAGPLHLMPPGRDAGGAAARAARRGRRGGRRRRRGGRGGRGGRRRRRCGWRRRALAPAGGQHGPEADRRGRVAGGETRHEAAPLLAQDAHLGVDADPGRIVAATLTDRDEDDAAQVGPLLDQVAEPVACVTADGAFDQDRVYADVAERHPDADVIVPPRSTAVPSATAETVPTQRDRHLQLIAEKGRMGWQKATGYNARARAEAAISRYKRVIGDGLRAHTDERRATEMDVAVHVLNRVLELGRPESVRIA